MWEFVATKMLRSGMGYGVDVAFEVIEEIGRKHGFVPMKKKKFQTILSNLRGFDVQGRVPDESDDFWIQQDNVLRRLNNLERLMFKHSIAVVFNNLTGMFVIDDELHGSKAGDVELKSVTNRKAGKEGPVSDCIACSATSAMLGMRLRVVGESQQSNVESLLDTISGPMINSDTTLAFDRGYGKKPFIDSVVSRGFSITTVAATIGSRHPFIPEGEYKEYETRWKAGGESVEELKERKELLSDWIVEEEDSLLGAEVVVATLPANTADGQALRATIIRDVFDRKADSKLLRFFGSGKRSEKLDKIWVAKEKKQHVPRRCLFHPKNRKVAPTATKDSKRYLKLRKKVEDRLLLNCVPLTCGQRCADWFLQRQFRLTGTMVSSLVSQDRSGGEDNGQPSHEQLQRWFDKAIDSWFGRHKSTSAMKQGSANEDATFNKFAMEEGILNCFEVGLLQHKRYPYLGVSPDGVAVIRIAPNDWEEQQGADVEPAEASDQRTALACVEIKTRTSPTTINSAEQALAAHGRVVHCCYNDDTFKACVPSEHRGQVLHQAFVAGLSHGVYVISKVQENYASIIQVVIVKIDNDTKVQHETKLVAIAKPLLEWFFVKENRERGFLRTEDFPQWLREDRILNEEEQALLKPAEGARGRRTNKKRLPLTTERMRKVIASRGQLFYGFDSKIRKCEDDGFTAASSEPPPPILLFKHGAQYVYNKCKGGLDNATELESKIRLGYTNHRFEVKYILRMIDAIIVNSWRANQALFDILPLLNNTREGGEESGNMSVEEIRYRLKPNSAKQIVSLQEYRYRLAVDMLVEINRQRNSFIEREDSHQTSGIQRETDAEERVLMNGIANLRHKHKFPVKRKRAEFFAKDVTCKKLRTYTGPNIRHYFEDVKTDAKEQRLPCVLCSKKGQERKTKVMCGTCKVPLCEKPLSSERNEEGKKGETCFVRWHTCTDLIQCQREQRDKLAVIRNKGQTNGETGNLSDDVDLDDVMMEFL